MAKPLKPLSTPKLVEAPLYAETAAERLRMLLVVVGMSVLTGWEIRTKNNLRSIEASAVFDQWMASGADYPAEAAHFEARARLALAKKGVSERELAQFAKEGSAHADFLRHALYLFLNGCSSFREWGASRQAMMDEVAAEREERGAHRNDRVFEMLAEAQSTPEGKTTPMDVFFAYRAHGDRNQGKPSKDERATFNALPRQEQKRQMAESLAKRERINDGLGLIMGLTHNEERLKAARALFDAVKDERFMQNPQNWALGITPRQTKSALEWIVALHETARGVDNYVGEGTSVSGLAKPIESTVEALHLRRRAMRLDAETEKWARDEVAANDRMDSLTASTPWTLCMRAPGQSRAYLAHLRARFGVPFQALPENPTVEEAFPDWSLPPAPGNEAGLGRKSLGEFGFEKTKGEQPSLALTREAVEAQARELGPLGGLAVEAARIYGLSAASGTGLVGAARAALMSEAGWSAGVWRLAANSEEFAQSCASTLKKQAAEVQKQRRKLIKKGIFEGDGALGALVEADSRLNGSKSLTSVEEQAKAFKNWLQKKRVALLGSAESRALMAIGQAAMVRNDNDPSFAILARNLSPVSGEGFLRQETGDLKSAWLVETLAACAPKITGDGDAAALLGQALQEQGAMSISAPVWAAALAEGLGRRLKEAAEAAPRANAAEIERAAFRAFAVDAGALRDCVLASPGFMQALPKKFNWGFLMRQQERWHEERRNEKFEKSGAASLAWAPVAASFVSGDLSATPLADARALYEEGQKMHHCVFSYAERCHEGRERIVSIQRAGQRVSTLELFPLNAARQQMNLAADGSNAHKVHSWKIGQNNGPCNAQVKDTEVLAFCDAYATRLMEVANELREAARAEEATAASLLGGKSPRPKKKKNDAEDAPAQPRGRASRM